jgi:uncharacterized membrane protein YgcG
MIGYNQELLKNLRVQELAKEWFSKKLITEENLRGIMDRYSSLPYQPNWFVKIGLFIFTCVCILGGTLIFLPFADFENAEKFISPGYGIILFFALNYFIKNRKLYFSGIDNALLYTIPLCFAFQVMELGVFLGDTPWLIGLCYLPILVLLVYFYGEPLVSLVAYLDLLFIVAAVSFEFSIGKLLLPFILFSLSILCWLSIRHFQQKETTGYWSVCFTTLHYATLCTAYISINYGIVRGGNMSLNGLPSPSPEITFSGIFWALTFLVPAIYLFTGYRLRKISFLILSGLFLLFSFLTWHSYYPVLSSEWTVTLVGTLGLILFVLLIRALKTPQKGFSYTPEGDLEVGILLGNIIATQAGSLGSDTPSGPKFGGGDFGGGGSEATY